MKTTIIVWLKAKTCRHALNEHGYFKNLHVQNVKYTALQQFFIGNSKMNDSANTGDNPTNAGDEKKMRCGGSNDIVRPTTMKQ